MKRKGLWLLVTATAALAGCGTTPRPVAPAGDPVPGPRVMTPASPVVVTPLQRHPNCLPFRSVSTTGLRAAVGIRAETCIADDGKPSAFVVRLIDIHGIRSPAREAGIEVGDQIVAIDQCQVGTAGELTLEIEGIPEGNTAELLVRRRGFPVRKFQVMTHRWRPANPLQARLPSTEQNLCNLIQRPAAKR
jgi:hypothetical protein